MVLGFTFNKKWLVIPQNYVAAFLCIMGNCLKEQKTKNKQLHTEQLLLLDFSHYLLFLSV